MKKYISFLLVTVFAFGIAVAYQQTSSAEIDVSEMTDLTPCERIQKRIEDGRYDNFIDRVTSISENRKTRMFARIDALPRVPEDVKTALKDVVTAARDMRVDNITGLFDVLGAADCPIDEGTLTEINELFVGNYEMLKSEVEDLLDLLETYLEDDCPAAAAIMEDIRADMNQAADNLEGFYDDIKANYSDVEEMTNEELKEYLVMVVENGTVYFEFLLNELVLDTTFFHRAMIACVN